MRLRLVGLLLVGLAWTSVAAEGAAPKPAGAVAFVLDCSLSMNQPVVQSPGFRPISDEEPTTRFDAAQAMLARMLRDLAADGTHHVGVWLYGHRLAWEADTRHPELLSQDAYLEATVGFDALNGLLPGDDVEKAQPIKRFTAQEYESLSVRLNLTKPWGEKPLYLAIARAVEALADVPPAMPKSIIVLTDGGNKQKLARYLTNYQQISTVLEQNIVPIHFIHFGPGPEEPDQADATERELREVAEQVGGTLVHVKDADQLEVAKVLASSRKVMAAPVALPTDGEGDVEAKIAAAKAILAKPVTRTISGSVVYHGRPVTSATLSLEGTDIPAVKTDRQGRFLIRKVQAGREYKVRVKAVALNTIREKLVDLEVEEAAEEQPFLTIDLK